MERWNILNPWLILAVISIGFAPGVEMVLAQEVTLEHLEAMQISQPDNYIKELRAIIDSSSDPDIRERGIFTLTDIAIKRNETEKIVDFLKGIAYNEKQENVRTAAYANLNLIRSIHPLEKKGSMEVELRGDIRKGGTVTVVAQISSTMDVREVIIGLGDMPESIEPISRPVQKFNLLAGQPQEAKFDLRINDVGSHYIPINFMMGFDRVDYETIKKRIYLTAEENGGELIKIEDA